jgi:hypothetical protein
MLINRRLGNSVVSSQENGLPLFRFAGGGLTGDRVALEIGQQRRMLLPLSQSLIEFGGMR